jgi:hypothetical protein
LGFEAFRRDAVAITTGRKIIFQDHRENIANWAAL